MFLHAGFDNIIMTDKIIAVAGTSDIGVLPAPVVRDVHAAQDRNQFIDLTNGRKKASVIYLTDGYVAASAISAETIASRLKNGARN